MQRLLRGLRSPKSWIAVAPLLVFFISVLVLPPNTIAIITNGLDIGGWVLLMYVLMPVWVRLLRRDRESPESYLFGAVILMTSAIAASMLWSLAIIVAGKPAWMINHWFQSFCYLMVGLSIFYLLSVPGYKLSMKYVMWALLVALCVMAFLVMYIGE